MRVLRTCSRSDCRSTPPPASAGAGSLPWLIYESPPPHDPRDPEPSGLCGDEQRACRPEPPCPPGPRRIAASRNRRRRRNPHASKHEGRRSIAPTASVVQAPRAGLEPATNRLHRVPPFPTGVDYLITVGLAACRWRALVGRLFFRHSLVSAPSLRPVISEGLAQGYHMLDLGRSHVGFPEFTRFSLTGFPARLRIATADCSTD